MAELERKLGSSDIDWEKAAAALALFLDACVEPRFRRIVLEEGPIVLGWAEWRALDQQFTGDVLARVLSGLMDAGLIERQEEELLARLCCATIAEAALAIAQSNSDSAEMKERAMQIMLRMMSGLRAS